MEDEKQYFKTSDMYHGVLLRALGLNLANILSNPSNFLTFVFEDPKNKAQKIIDDYWNKKVSVDAKTFVECINEIKTRIHSNKNGD